MSEPWLEQIEHLRAERRSRRRFLRDAIIAGIGLSTIPGSIVKAAPAPPRRGGTLTIVRPIDTFTLDPVPDWAAPSQWVMVNLHEGLIKLDTDLTVKPGLAERWEQIAPDRIRFYLRRGVKFHDGTSFDAAAVKFNFDRWKANPVSLWVTGLKTAVVNDTHAVDIVTDGPYSPLFSTLSLPWLAIVSPTAVKKFGEDFGRNPAGTGPFKLVDWRTNVSLTLERWDGYWGNKPYLDRVVYRVVPEESARMLALRTGQADMVLHPAAPELPSLRTDRQFSVHSAVGMRVVFIGCQLQRPPMDDVRVRRALNIGFNRRPVIDNILEGAANLATAPIAPGVLGYKDVSATWAYDPARAERLLDEAGWRRGADGMRSKDGQPLVLKHYSPRARYYKDAQISEAFQASMRGIGVRVDLQIIEWAIMGPKWGAGFDSELFTLGYVTTTADPDSSLVPLFGCGSRQNAFEYCNEKVQELLLRGRRIFDREQRAGLYTQALEMIAQESMMLPVYTTRETIVTRAAVQGFKVHPIEYFLWLSTTWLG